MAHTAIPEEEIEEFFDDDSKVNEAINQLAEAIKKNKGGLVIYTGAGVSTSCGISDFRGPNGIWTRQSQIQRGIKVEEQARVTKPAFTQPSPTHMAIVALDRAGYLQKLISTNCDGLHIRSGVSPNKIVELHGNCHIEACPQCGHCYYREEPVDIDGFDRSRAVLTGRKCDRKGCGAFLRRTDVAFGQSMPDIALATAKHDSETAKVVLVLGTSLRVQPACKLPFLNRKATSCIVNLQKTPYDSKSSIRIFTPTDNFILKLFGKLNLQIPEYSDSKFFLDADWSKSFERFYPFRSFPDDSWFDSRDDEVALRFLEEQKKGIGIKLVTDDNGQVKMERFVVDDEMKDANQDPDLDGFEIYPKKNCPHIHFINPGDVIGNINGTRIAEGCQTCGEAEENWLCLTCNSLLCGRMKNQHMLQHAEASLFANFDNPTEHILCASLMDLSFWCYACNSYVTSPVLTPIFNELHLVKFGTEALPIHDIM